MLKNPVVKMSEGQYPIMDNTIYYCIDTETIQDIIQASKEIKPKWYSICIAGDNAFPKINEDTLHCIDDIYGLYSIETIPETSEDNINNDTTFVDFTEIHVSPDSFYIRMETADIILTSMAIPLDFITK